MRRAHGDLARRGGTGLMEVMKASPAMALLSREISDKSIWIKTAVLFEMLFLINIKLDIWFDLFSQPVAIPKLRR